MISVAVYHEEYNQDEDTPYIWVDELIICSACGRSELIYKGWRKRKVITITEAIMIMMIRRVKCKHCKKIHHVLPDIIVPYKRNTSETIDKIKEGHEDETLCEENVINRIKSWWQKLRLYILMAAAKYNISISSESCITKIVRALANANLWPGTRSALALGQENCIIMTNQQTKL